MNFDMTALKSNYQLVGVWVEQKYNTKEHLFYEN